MHQIVRLDNTGKEQRGSQIANSLRMMEKVKDSLISESHNFPATPKSLIGKINETRLGEFPFLLESHLSSLLARLASQTPP